MSSKKAKVLPIHKKESRQLKKIAGQYLCYQFVGKFLKNSFLTSCINILRSRVRIEVRPIENDSTRLHKNGDISVVITSS